MIEPKVFAELQNRGIITQVGLKSEDFKNLTELEKFGLVTNVFAEKEYENIVNTMEPDCEIVSNEDELIAAVEKGGIYKLTADITLTKYLNVKSDLTINLNNHTLLHPATSTDSYKDVFEVMTGGKLTVNGDGNVIAEDGYAVYAAGDSVVTLNGGSYFSPVSAVDARKHASVTINGGTFKVDGSANADGDFGQKFTLNLRDKKGNYTGDLSEIIVKGGKFWKYNPAMSESEPEITNFVAEGYISVAEGDWYVVKEAEIIVDDNQ